VKPLCATWKPVGEVLPSPALQQPSKLRTTTDGIAGDAGQLVTFITTLQRFLGEYCEDRRRTPSLA
jgi:hypothetical protein